MNAMKGINWTPSTANSCSMIEKGALMEIGNVSDYSKYEGAIQPQVYT